VNTFFDYVTTNLILKIPLIEFVLSDAPTWKFEKVGEYTMSSVYCQTINTNNDAMQHRVEGHWSSSRILSDPLKLRIVYGKHVSIVSLHS
jgi:hypothetical protein